MGDVHKLPVQDFEVLPNEYLLTLIDGTSAEVFKNLSNDHQILLRLLRMVTTGELEERYTAMKIGPVVTSTGSFRKNVKSKMFVKISIFTKNQFSQLFQVRN